MQRIAILVVVLLGAGTIASSDAARPRTPMTMQLGRGLGPYRIGMPRVVLPGRIRTIRQPANDGPGCSGGFVQDSHVDVYPGLRLGYGSGGDKQGFLDTIATTRRGDRTSLGYAIGVATLADVRRRYPKVKLSRHKGGSSLTIFRRTGYESGAHVEYDFDAAGRLVRLETGVGGC